MKTKLALSLTAAAVALFSQASLAQTTAPASRADVKAEAKTTTSKAGEAVGPATSTPAGTTSTRSRAERKETTKMEAKSGDLKPAGELANRNTEKADKTKATEKTRAERKEETKAAARAGQTQPAGEAAQATTGGAPKK
jgi:hypothetical protein